MSEEELDSDLYVSYEDEESLKNAIKERYEEANGMTNMNHVQAILQNCEFLQNQLHHLQQKKLENQKEQRQCRQNKIMVAATVVIALATVVYALVAFLNMAC